ncbi:MAG: phage tail assembly protein [Pseudodesulfovibrio sp.]|uniref:Mu-like prophage FluMu protein gp41 n=1 Tax=Pseudodesulfovibrio aespoeensis (strain ATCC 700646 / DSM 10631 / Aspo-2) TaxID=643562 RepID=E6VU92_PSEA9|nr:MULTISPECIES: phage tail assembly protein [Pseudodesulfovibrio]MBU4191332.1 phage tail assembly protein [Pseudomonadota bacterium]ADU63399.1 Mu-like prophage FluMu protein gp41 [Pseudodesulfovibrio aespoeensis Aspo-2]MBU4243446.1 phage tail assembly protein [Pseudomonadota bacterium]MBU4378624.1 phage tail assembly protein [Pseudomonadota bacterium]MBU4473780.1 phage tail assembly protein [Pseudomonadota bacterium]
MADNITFPLVTGLPVGDEFLRDVTLREVRAGDIIEAQEEAEKLVHTPGGPALVASPTLLGLGVLRRQIVSIGNVQGPISLKELKRLTPHDLGMIQAEADRLDAAVAMALARQGADRGRSDGAHE